MKSHLWGPHLNARVNLFLVSSGDDDYDAYF